MIKNLFYRAGYNFEPSEIGAAFGLAQMKKLKTFLKLRNRNFNLHKKFFERFDNLFIVPKILSNIKTNFLSYPIILKQNKLFNRKQLQIFLERNNVQTRPIFRGIF